MSLRTLFCFLHQSLIVTVISILAPRPSWAENSASEPPQVKFVVRTIQAAIPRTVSPDREKASTEITVEPSLVDLKDKLVLLPFSSFRLIASSAEDLSLKQKESIRLPNGQTLAFRPMYIDQERIGLWLSWRDVDGSDILNTRIHFDADESVVTGTDYRENEGRILAIKALRAP